MLRWAWPSSQAATSPFNRSISFLFLMRDRIMPMNFFSHLFSLITYRSKLTHHRMRAWTRKREDSRDDFWYHRRARFSCSHNRFYSTMTFRKNNESSICTEKPQSLPSAFGTAWPEGPVRRGILIYLDFFIICEPKTTIIFACSFVYSYGEKGLECVWYCPRRFEDESVMGVNEHDGGFFFIKSRLHKLYQICD